MRYVLIRMKNHNTRTHMCKMIIFAIKQTGALLQKAKEVKIMALDCFFYDVNDNDIDYFSMSESLHEAIFNNRNKYYRSYIYLRKLINYYGDAKFEGNEVKSLIEDLKLYLPYINKDYHEKVYLLIKKLSDPRVVRVGFYGD